jgi:hypothetical protein
MPWARSMRGGSAIYINDAGLHHPADVAGYRGDVGNGIAFDGYDVSEVAGATAPRESFILKRSAAFEVEWLA